jgi:hypothetical protein
MIIILIFLLLLIIAQIIFFLCSCKGGINYYSNVYSGGGNKYSGGIKDKYSYNFKHNLQVASTLLHKKFNSLQHYTNQEKEFILLASSKEWPLPNIWMNLSLPALVPYRENKQQIIAHHLTYNHSGQRKLFLVEMELLTNFLSDAGKNVIILYAGAAPAIHIPLFIELFPNCIWHLYDPAKFAIKENKNIKIYNKFFTDETAKEWNKKCDIFICDIRLDNKVDFENQVNTDMKMQDRWTRLIEPRKGASLKFRPPYTYEDILYEYINGRILWQMCPPKASTETRLIVDAKDANMHSLPMKISIRAYQNLCAEHNIIDRPWKTYKILHLDVKHILGYDRCFDCTCEAMCWLSYMKLKNTKKRSLSEHMNALTKITHQPLKSNKTMHGHFQFDTAAVRISKMI